MRRRPAYVRAMTDQPKKIIPGLDFADFSVIAPNRTHAVVEVRDTDGGHATFNANGNEIGRYITGLLVAASQLEAPRAPPGDAEMTVSSTIPATSCGVVRNEREIGLTVRVGPVDLVFPMTKQAMENLAREILDEGGLLADPPPEPTKN